MAGAGSLAVDVSLGAVVGSAVAVLVSVTVVSVGVGVLPSSASAGAANTDEPPSTSASATTAEVVLPVSELPDRFRPKDADTKTIP